MFLEKLLVLATEVDFQHDALNLAAARGHPSLVVPDHAVDAQSLIAFAEGVPHALPEVTLHRRHLDGAAAVRDPDGHLTGFVKVTRDLTPQKEAQSEREAFLAILAHDIKTPATAIKGAIRASSVDHGDETGIRVNGQTKWLHVVSTWLYTYYYWSKHRGQQAHQADGLLPSYGGILMHDAYQSYFGHSYTHALCNAHLLRELQAIYEAEPSQRWSKDALFAGPPRLETCRSGRPHPCRPLGRGVEFAIESNATPALGRRS